VGAFRGEEPIVSALLHNMSAPPRTNVRVEKRAIAKRVVAFSLTYALVAGGYLDARAVMGNRPEAKELQRDILAKLPDLADAIRGNWSSPGDLFARIGEPQPLLIKADFLIGWRATIDAEEKAGWFFCPDPQLAAGVQARCSGGLYLSRRAPDLTWERLLSQPIAFDEPSLNSLFL